MPRRSRHEETIKFHIFDNLAEGVRAVLGLDFLRTRYIFEAFSHLLCDRSRPASSILKPRLMNVSPTGVSYDYVFHVFLNGVDARALPDTGSDVNALSKRYAKRHGSPIVELSPGDPHRICLATGLEVSVRGKAIVQVNAAKMKRSAGTMARAEIFVNTNLAEPEHVTKAAQKQGDNTIPSGYEAVFFILDEVIGDVILGQCVLHAMDAFRCHGLAFDYVPRVQGLNLLNFAGLRVKKDGPPRCEDGKLSLHPDLTSLKVPAVDRLLASDIRRDAVHQLSPLKKQKVRLQENLKLDAAAGDATTVTKLERELRDVEEKIRNIEQDCEAQIQALNNESEDPDAGGRRKAKRLRRLIDEAKHGSQQNVLAL